MIPAKYKLSLRKINSFFATADRFYSRYFVFFVQKNLISTHQSQIAVIIPKKNVKLRVKRSLLKRRVYAICLPLLKETQAQPLAIVIVGNKKIKDTTWLKLKQDIEKSWPQLLVKNRSNNLNKKILTQ